MKANRMKTNASWKEIEFFCKNMMKTRQDLNDLYTKDTK